MSASFIIAGATSFTSLANKEKGSDPVKVKDLQKWQLEQNEAKIRKTNKTKAISQPLPGKQSHIFSKVVTT